MHPESPVSRNPQARPWEVTADLLARYDRPGPRYTSYPTAVEFHTGVGPQAYEECLARADELVDAPFSLYVHMPFCEKRCLFCGCNVIISPEKSRAAPYLDLLLREAELVAARLPRRRRLSQVHLGGGTPTYFPVQDLTGFLVDVFHLFPPLEDAELAVEIDPRVTGEDQLEALAEIGFNRVSLGVQDVAPEVQHSIGRVQPLERTARLIEFARSRGYSGINVDLIYGLPHQTPGGFADTVDAVVDVGIDRAAVYSFAYMPQLHAHQKRLPSDAMPDRNTKLALFAAAREHFLAAGFETIGMDHFAKPDDELSIAKRQGRLKRNFQGYCVVPADDVLALGISAIGDVAGLYVQNTKKLSVYSETLENGRLPVERGVALSADDRLRRRVIHELMCNFRIDIPAIETMFGIDFATYFAEDLALLEEHERDGMVSISRDRIATTATGELFVRNLAMCFDRYLRNQKQGAAPRFSRTV